MEQGSTGADLTELGQLGNLLGQDRWTAGRKPWQLRGGFDARARPSELPP